MDTEKTFERLNFLIEELEIKIELGVHDRVARLALEIANELVDIYEQQLEAQEEQSLDGKIHEDPEWQSIEAVLSKLREISLVASAYNDVTEFVRLKVSIGPILLRAGITTGRIY